MDLLAKYTRIKKTSEYKSSQNVETKKDKNMLDTLEKNLILIKFATSCDFKEILFKRKFSSLKIFLGNFRIKKSIKLIRIPRKIYKKEDVNNA